MYLELSGLPGTSARRPAIHHLRAGGVLVDVLETVGTSRAVKLPWNEEIKEARYAIVEADTLFLESPETNTDELA